MKSAGPMQEEVPVTSWPAACLPAFTAKAEAGGYSVYPTGGRCG